MFLDGVSARAVIIHWFVLGLQQVSQPYNVAPRQSRVEANNSGCVSLLWPCRSCFWSYVYYCVFGDHFRCMVSMLIAWKNTDRRWCGNILRICSIRCRLRPSLTDAFFVSMRVDIFNFSFSFPGFLFPGCVHGFCLFHTRISTQGCPHHYTLSIKFEHWIAFRKFLMKG